MTRTQPITLDVYEAPYFVYVNAKQKDNDSRVLVITLTDQGKEIKPDHTSDEAVFRARKPDGTCVLAPATIGEDGKITVALSDQTLAVPGDVEADVAVVNGDDVLSTATFYIQVARAPVGQEIASENDFLLLLEARDRAEAAARAAAESAETAGEHEQAAGEHETAAGESAGAAARDRQAAETAAKEAGEHEAAAGESAEKAAQERQATETAAEEAKKSAQTAVQYSGRPPVIGEDGTWETWDAESGTYVDTGNPSRGETGPRGEEGPQGKDGSDGEPGFSPTIDVQKEGKTTTVTITAEDGPHVATILDGEDGAGAVESVNGQTGAVEIVSLPNPEPLTFTGAANAVYDGSEAKSVAIPARPTAAEMFLAAHPVGNYYWSNNATSPASLFGGQWEQITGRFVLAAGGGYNVNATGGVATHTHGPGTYAAEINSNGAEIEWNSVSTAQWPVNWCVRGSSYGALSRTDTYGAGIMGNSAEANSLPPYIAAYCWRRTA